MREVLSLHVGQAGCGVGVDMWKQFWDELGNPHDGTSSERKGIHDARARGESTFFTQSSSGIFTPRAVFVDTDPMVHDSVSRLSTHIQNECFRDNIISCKRDARSVYHAGKKECQETGIADSAFEKVMDLAESCDNLGGLIVQRSIGGGTGSAVGDILLTRLRDEFPKTVILETLIYPSRESSTSALEPINTILSLSASRESPSLSLVLDNQSAYRIARTKLGQPEPSFFEMNSFIARVASSCTASLRFPATLNSSLEEVVTNLVPDPVLRYAIVSMAPLSAHTSSTPTAKELLSSLFHPQSYLCEVPTLRDHPQIAACIQCQGTLELANIQKSIQSFRTSQTLRHPIKFAPWISTSFKVGLVQSSSVAGGTLLSNSTAVAVPLEEQLQKFESLMTSRKYLWHYMENGAEMDDFDSANASVKTLVEAYKSVKDSCQQEDQNRQLQRIKSTM
jgi:tubulin alpha